MRIFKIIVLVLFAGSIFLGTLQAQDSVKREAYAAGKFYENDLAELLIHLNALFSETEHLENGTTLAVISPHAGFAFSGEVAAWGFRQIDPNRKFQNIFILASSHTMAIPGASIFSAGNYETPLGDIVVNTSLAEQLISSNPYLFFLPAAHIQEHSIENQLPFLQYYLSREFQIVPILIGTDNSTIIKSIAETLKPFLNNDNLFVISSDFSHYPNYDDACYADSLVANGLISNNIATFEKAIRTNARQHYPGLVTSACGRSALLTLLNMTEELSDVEFIPIKYANSGDVPIGEKNRVVGYYSIVLAEEKKESNSYLSSQDTEDLINIARLTLDEYISTNTIPQLDPEQFNDKLKVSSGAFVTLNKNHQLRGCIGRFFSDEPLYLVVQQMAIAAASQDYRFQKVKPEELDAIEIEISVLTPLKKIQSAEEFELGRDGIYIVKGNQSGTFLPQVATETGWSKEEFLGHCSRDKAGIGWNGWKEAELYIYQAIVISESEVFQKKDKK